LHPNATLILLLAANVPDADVISAVGGTEAYFHYHRWYTHALLAMPVMALLPVLAARALNWRKPFAWMSAATVSLVGVASHLALDWTNAYGIRLLLPFSDEWPALHATSVVDLWIWAILLVATLWPMLSRLVSSEIGARGAVGRGWALAAILFLPVYNVGRWFLYQRAVDVQESRMYEGQTPRRAIAFPTPFNPLLWKGVVETSTSWIVQDVNLAQELDPGAAQVLYKPESSPSIDAVRRTPEFQRFEKFSRTLWWRTTPARDLEGGTEVEAVDLRFGFTATAVVDAQGQVRQTSFSF
jgi:inner membrane protein